MKYTLDTIPVLDAYRTGCECPLCKMRIQSEDSYVDSMLGAAYMEPDCRVRTNEIGFCSRHFELMYDRRNRLGLALMTHTHMQEVIKSMEDILAGAMPKGGFLASLSRSKGGEETAPAKIRVRIGGCVICDDLNNALNRYAYTIAQLYFSHTEFKQLFENSKGCCLPHLALGLEMAGKTLSAEQTKTFQKKVAEIELANLKRIEGELEWFTLKFDYRNTDKPWGNSKDAVERSINKLMGAIVGDESEMPAHND